MTNRTDGAAESFPKDTCMERGSSVSRRREDTKACLVKWKDLYFFCQVHLVSNLKAAARGGRKNKDRE
ncbi:hypothetical protein TNCT_282351 [Trichonephila clavata]|uniref:Uncharacterized protein n=1 Tax=Trichonephila clavata TaxID=2740835 RepID=A0A8X6J4Q5_TRICU|nr:hypothetical protein TNCT_282351 [Trichonephila clavata]